MPCWQVDRYTRRLDQELSKFKMELEADNAGITEMLEKSKYFFFDFDYYRKQQVSISYATPKIKC